MPIKRAGAAALVAAAFCAACAQAGPVPPDGVLQIEGVLTGEGVECPALRGHDGQLYTLAGAPDGAIVGDALCVQGRLVEISICQQGITLEVETISAAPCGS